MNQIQSVFVFLAELQGKLKTATENEKLSRDECINLQRKVLSLEQQISTAYNEIEKLKVELEKVETEKTLLEQDLTR